MASESSTRRSVVSGTTYALANAGQRALTFLLLPVYTAALSPAEYGRLGLLATIQAGTVIAFAAGMEAGVFREFFRLEGDDRGQQRFVISAWNVVLFRTPVLAALCAVGVVLFVPSTDVFRPREGALTICVAAMAVAASSVPLTVLRAEQRLREYVTLSAILGLTNAVLTVVFVVGLHLGVGGWLFATLLAYTVSLAAALYLIPWRRIEKFDREGVRRAMAVGLPLIPHSASLWSLQLADRIVLSTLVTAGGLGVYTLGANLALPAAILVAAVSQGFMPTYARRRKSLAGTAEMQNAVTAQIVLSAVIGCAVALLGAALASLMSSSYASAAHLMPWLALGYVFYGIYFVPMNSVSLIAGRTTHVWIVTLTAAAVNLGMIVTLAPSYGVIVAAEASAAGYLVLLLLVSGYAWRVGVRLPIDWRRIVPITLVVGATFAIGDVFMPVGGVGSLVERSLLLVTLPVTVILAAGIRPSRVIGQARRVVRRDATAVSGADERGAA